MQWGGKLLVSDSVRKVQQKLLRRMVMVCG
jgi:hypothetical protein